VQLEKRLEHRAWKILHFLFIEYLFHKNFIPFDILMKARLYLRQIKPLLFVRDLLPLSLLMLTNSAIFSPFAVPPESFTALSVYSCGGKVTRYFTLFFELDSFPLAIITTSFGPCLETDGDGKEGGNRRSRGEFVYSSFRVTP